MARKPSVTIRDVAKKAGVSVATVSRVLNKSALVTAETRARIEAVTGKLHYVPNASARGLSTRRNDIIGLLLPAVNGDFFSEVIRGADAAAQEHGFHFLISSHHNELAEIQSELQAMTGRVDGLILMSPNQDAHLLRKSILPRGLPVVLLNCPPEGEPIDALTVDNTAGATAIVRHLVDHGHRRIAILTGRPENVDARERLAGYRIAIRAGSCERSGDLELEGNFDESSGYEAVRTLLYLKPRPTALFVSNDAMAVGALSALRDAGIKVPDDIAIAGFDDTPVARYLTPPLTTVHVPISELGTLAMQRLINHLRTGKRLNREHGVLPVETVIRQSCGCH